MRISELMEHLEDFMDQYGDQEVIVNRNGREYPVFIKASGAYPGYIKPRSLSENSGYFEYVDEDVDTDDAECPYCGEIMRQDYVMDNYHCDGCDATLSGKEVRAEYFDIKEPNACVLND